MPTPTTTTTNKDVIGTLPGGVQAFVGGTPITSPVSPTVTPVTTSDSARDGYSAINDAIAKLNKSAPNISVDYNGKTYDSTANLIGANRTSLEARKAADLARISTEYAQNQEALGQSQKSETGTASMGLARIGGFDSASGQAALTNLQRVHTSEQNALIAQRENAIRTAQNAYEDKDFALAQLQVDEAKKTEQLIYDRNKDFISMTLQLRGEQRADLAQELQQAQFDYQKNRDTKSDQRTAVQFALDNNIKTPFYLVGGIGYDTRTGEALSYEDYIARGGKEDWSNAFIVEPGSKEARAFVFSLAAEYPDAGIDPRADDVVSAQKKIQGSRLYKEKFYHPSSGGGSGADDIKGARNAFLSTLMSEWKDKGILGGNGKINSDSYKQAKASYTKLFTGYVDNPGKDFDDNVSLYVDRGNVGQKDTDPSSTTYGQVIKGTDWQADYGINP